MKHFLTIVFFLGILLYFGCDDKFPVPTQTGGEAGNIDDTVYVKQNPDWTGFNKPEDIIIGREPFVYVADTYNDRIVMLNVAGQVLGTKKIKHPVEIAQDYKLNLLVCAEFDTTINGSQVSFSAVYKIDMVTAGHIIENAPVKRLLPQNPKVDPFAFSRPDRQYTGITVFYDNSFYVARTGPSNSNPVDRDNAILHIREVPSEFTGKDTLYISKVPGLAAEGTGLMSANKISSLTSLGRHNFDFVLTLIGENSFKVQWLHYVNTADFSGYQSQLQPFESDLMAVNRFGKPEGVTFDDKNNIFVADAEKDSIFSFNNFGDEMESFGGSDVFNHPHAVAFYDRTLYVADTDNNRIVRFILSTEID